MLQDDVCYLLVYVFRAFLSQVDVTGDVGIFAACIIVCKWENLVGLVCMSQLLQLALVVYGFLSQSYALGLYRKDFMLYICIYILFFFM